MHFETEKKLQEFIADKLAQIRQLFAEVTEAEKSFYGHSPSREAADAVKNNATQ